MLNPYPQLITPPVVTVHIFGQIFDQDLWDQKIQCTVLQGREILRKFSPLPPGTGPDGTDGMDGRSVCVLSLIHI